MSESYHLVQIKRPWIPEWLYRLACIRLPFFGYIALIQPIRWALHNKPGVGIPDTKTDYDSKP